MKPGLSALFSSADEQEIIVIGEAVSTVCFRLGDIANAKIDLLNQYATDTRLSFARRTEIMQISNQDIFSHIASLAGKSARRIREYAQVSRFFAPEIREVYFPLKFSHFQVAMGFGDTWEGILQTCLKQMDANGGRCPSVDWVLSNFIVPGDAEPDQSIPDQIQVLDAGYKDQEEGALPDPIIPDATVILLQSISRMVTAFLSRMSVPARVMEKLRLIQDLCKEVMAEVEK